MRKLTLVPLGLAVMLSLSACESWDRMINGKSGDPDPAPAASGPLSPNAPVERFDLFKDGGGAMNTDPESHMSVTGGMILIHGTGGAGEGSEYLRIHVSSGPHISGTFTMSFDLNNVNRTQDLSGRNTIVFMIRFLRPILPTDQLTFSVEDGHGVVRTFPLQSLTGLDPNAFGAVWQTVQFPLSSLAGLDLTKIRRPLKLESGSMSSTDHLDVDFDDVRYEP